MKISITDTGSGITQKFAKAIGATTVGRYVYIPENKGEGYLTGFSWGSDLRMMIRNYHLKEPVIIERTNELTDDQDDVVFLLSGVFPPPVLLDKQLAVEQAHIMICKHAVSSIINMPSNTLFGSVTIAVSRQHLYTLFEFVAHPVVKSVLEAQDNFVFETSVSPEIIKTASEFLQQSVPESLEKQYYKLKCEELLCHIFAVLMQRDTVPAGNMHIDDIKAIYSIKTHLQSQLEEPPNIAGLAKDAKMSEPKLRKLFKQIFGKGIFEYYQSARMQEAARLLREKRLSVSEVGYLMGFTNLSHFTRVFELHIGIKPKKYSANVS